MKASRMFPCVTITWNPVTGCLHHCKYCWARPLAEGKLRNLDKYKNGFKPALWEKAFVNTLGKNKFVFVSDMGDLFGEWVPSKWIEKVLNKVCRSHPSNLFMFLTKNPIRYKEFLHLYPKNAILGATIETNHDYNVSKAPKPKERYEALRSLEYPRKTVSIEPIMDFDIEVFASWMKEIKPEFVHLGYDNYGYKLTEPELEKTLALISILKKFTDIRTKTIRKAWWE